MNILHQSIQSAFTNSRAELDELGDQYFDEAKHKMMKDLVDFNQREDFEMYMRGLEKNYYDQLNFPKAPYDVFPDYPPKPFQSKPKKKLKESQKKDYIDRANEINMKRQQSYSSSWNSNQQPPANPMADYMYSVQAPMQSLNQTPFFSSIRPNDGNKMQSSYLATPKYTPIGQPNSAIPQGFRGDKFGQLMEPSQMTQQPPFMQKFIAGPTRLESNPLGEPSRNFKPSSPQRQQTFQMNDYDLKNPDVQFERYKQLMQHQYYNNHANSNQLNALMGRPNTTYQQPPFNQPQPLQQKDIYNMSFNPQRGVGNQPPPPNNQQLSQMYPQQIYDRPNSSISLYNQQHHQQMPNQLQQQIPGYENFQPEFYRSLQQKNNVDKQLIESLGGIENTIKPLEESLKQHELRPFYIQKDYNRELKLSSRGQRSYSINEIKPENMKLVSVSPYRAVIKIDDSKKYNYSDEEREKEDAHENEEEEEEDEHGDKLDMYNQIRGVISNNNPKILTQNQSPIRTDSEYLRGQRENYLKNFNEQKEVLSKPFGQLDFSGFQNQNPNNLVPQSKVHQKQYRKMKNQSEYLRGQREGFLNSFSQSRFSNNQLDGGKSIRDEDAQNFDYHYQNQQSLY